MSCVCHMKLFLTQMLKTLSRSGVKKTLPPSPGGRRLAGSRKIIRKVAGVLFAPGRKEHCRPGRPAGLLGVGHIGSE